MTGLGQSLPNPAFALASDLPLTTDLIKSTEASARAKLLNRNQVLFDLIEYCQRIYESTYSNDFVELFFANRLMKKLLVYDRQEVVNWQRLTSLHEVPDLKAAVDA
jgi:hypothetical protein